jgi:hypothetical protein
MHSIPNGGYFYGEKPSRARRREYQRKGILILKRLSIGLPDVTFGYRSKENEKARQT